MKFAGVVVLYEPTSKDLSNIDTYINDIDRLYIVDNSLKPLTKSILNQWQNITYIFNNQNIGVASALNKAAQLAINEGYLWLLTLDQDTTFNNDALMKLKTFISNHDCCDIGIVTPWHETKLRIKKPNTSIDYPKDVMTSGNFINLEIHQKIGGYRDWLFIDGIDIEYCFNLRRQGYKIIRLNDVSIDHELGDIAYRPFLNREVFCSNHSSIRRYYMTRNYCYIRDLYIDFESEFVTELAKQKRNIIVILFFENHKVSKIFMTIKGYLDYKRGIRGKYGCKESHVNDR